MNHVPAQAPLPEAVALRTGEMIHVLANDHWDDLTETQRDLIASVYYADEGMLTTAQAADITMLYGAVVGVRI